MFRPSGPDHMLIRTVMFCLFSLSFLQESESQCKTKRQNTTNHKMKVYKIVNLLPNFLKKGPPLRGKFPLLLHPELHLAENPPLLPFPNARPPNSRGCRQAAPCSRRWCWWRQKSRGTSIGEQKSLQRRTPTQGWLLVTWEQELLMEQCRNQFCCRCATMWISLLWIVHMFAMGCYNIVDKRQGCVWGQKDKLNLKDFKSKTDPGTHSAVYSNISNKYGRGWLKAFQWSYDNRRGQI